MAFDKFKLSRSGRKRNRKKLVRFRLGTYKIKVYRVNLIRDDITFDMGRILVPIGDFDQ